jgi:hypothetical protein
VETPFINNSAGAVYVLFGQSRNFPAALSLSALNGTEQASGELQLGHRLNLLILGREDEYRWRIT